MGAWNCSSKASGEDPFAIQRAATLAGTAGCDCPLTGLWPAPVGCQAGSAAGYGCGAQDISTRLSSLLYGATSVFAVIAGASGQYFTGWLLEQNGRDFTPMFALVVAVELAGLVAWNRWWDSERVFE